MSQHGVILALVAGLILSGILAATMSTADSQLLAAASSVSQDLVQGFFGTEAQPTRTPCWPPGGTVIGIAVVGMLLAWNPNSSVFRIVSFAWAGFGAAFGPVVLFALFWKRTNEAGRPGRHGRRRRDGLHVEVPAAPPWAAPGASTSCCPPSSWPASPSSLSPWPPPPLPRRSWRNSRVWVSKTCTRNSKTLMDTKTPEPDRFGGFVCPKIGGVTAE